MDTHRIKTKIGVHEFEAEGPEEVVTAQFEAWMKAISALPQIPVVPPQVPPPAPAHAAVNPPPAFPPVDGGVPQAIMDRVFRQADQGLTLAAKPSGENANKEAMLAILYGFLKIRGEATVTGAALMKAARFSGVQIPRVDRLMESMPDFVIGAGVNRGRRYQLNNPGVLKAEEVINGILK